MYPSSESHMAILSPIEHHFISAIEDRWVAVGGGKVHEELVPASHWASLELGVAGDKPGHRHRRIGPEELFYG
jgi:hypothetical protein